MLNFMIYSMERQTSGIFDHKNIKYPSLIFFYVLSFDLKIIFF